MSSTLWDMLADQLDPPPKPDYLIDPGLWVQDRAKAFAWSKQRTILESVRDHESTAVPSCHTAGKSRSAGYAACWWIDAHEPLEAFVVTTAPTGDQVKAILWREIGRLRKQGQLPGRTNLTEWYIDGELVAFGRKPNDYEPTAFQGIHAPFVLVILDEACGIPKSLWDAASTLTSNEGGRTLAIGNPDDPQSEFARVCRPDSGWNVIPISAYDTPNFTGEIVPKEVSRSLVSVKWVDGKAVQWGKQSPLYVSKVLGRFPTDAEEGVVPLSFVQRCREVQLAATAPVEAGLDVGAGGDRTVLQERRGPKLGRHEAWVESDPMVAVGSVVQRLREWEIDRVKVDVIGVGWAFAGRLKELSRRHHPDLDENDPSTHNAEVVDCNFGAQSKEPDRFANLRAEVYWNMRELARLQAIDLSVLSGQDGDDVAAEVTSPRYKILDSKGKIQVEKKEEVIKRLGVSPDRADALVMAFWSPHGEASLVDVSMYNRPMDAPVEASSSPYSRQMA